VPDSGRPGRQEPDLKPGVEKVGHACGSPRCHGSLAAGFERKARQSWRGDARIGDGGNALRAAHRRCRPRQDRAGRRGPRSHVTVLGRYGQGDAYVLGQGCRAADGTCRLDAATSSGFGRRRSFVSPSSSSSGHVAQQPAHDRWPEARSSEALGEQDRLRIGDWGPMTVHANGSVSSCEQLRSRGACDPRFEAWTEAAIAWAGGRVVADRRRRPRRRKEVGQRGARLVGRDV